MAQQTTWLCTTCGHSIGAWSDGNPYYIDEAGEKQYAYHPDHERLALCGVRGRWVAWDLWAADGDDGEPHTALIPPSESTTFRDAI